MLEERKKARIFQWKILELPQAVRHEYVLYRRNDSFTNGEFIKSMVDRLKYLVDRFNEPPPYELRTFKELLASCGE